MQKPAVRPLVMLISTVLLLATAGAQSLTVTDFLGRTVSLDAPAGRVVSLMPSHTETILALGAGSVLVGVDEHSDLPAGMDLPRTGNGFQPNLEAIIALDPDLVFTDQFSGVHDVLAELGVSVYAGAPETLDGIFTLNESAGELLGRAPQAADLNASISEAVVRARELAAGLPPLSVYAEADPTPFAAGPASYLGELLELLGAANIIPEGSGSWMQISSEFVLESDPDVIILLDAPYGESTATLLERPGWDGLTALRAGRVWEVSETEGDLLSRPGPGVGRALELLHGFLRQAAAAD